MFIAPVGSVSFKNNAPVNFGTKHRNDTEGSEYKPSQKRNVTDLAKMPVIVLLAMTPASSTEGKTPEQLVPVNPTEITYEMSEPEEDYFFIRTPLQETQQTNRPFGYEILKHEKIQYIQQFKARGEDDYNLVFTSAANKKENEVNFIYIIPKNSKGGKDISDQPPQVHQLIYHNIGKDKEYCGAIIEEDIIEEGTGKYKGTLRSEMRLPDETAQKIIDLITGYSKFENKTLVKIKETTNPLPAPMKIYE